MKGNNEKRKWYILIAVALIVGAIIGYFATNSLATTGNANAVSPNNLEETIKDSLKCFCNTGNPCSGNIIHSTIYDNFGNPVDIIEYDCDICCSTKGGLKSVLVYQ